MDFRDCFERPQLVARLQQHLPALPAHVRARMEATLQAREQAGSSNGGGGGGSGSSAGGSGASSSNSSSGGSRGSDGSSSSSSSSSSVISGSPPSAAPDLAPPGLFPDELNLINLFQVCLLGPPLRPPTLSLHLPCLDLDLDLDPDV